MEDPFSIWEHCVHGLDLPANDAFHLKLFVNAIEEIATDMNHFNKDKYPCAICGQKGHSFDGCPQFNNTNLEQAYIWLLLIVIHFIQGLKNLDPSSQNQDLQTVQGLTLSELDAIKHVDLQSCTILMLFLPCKIFGRPDMENKFGMSKDILHSFPCVIFC